MLLEGRNCDLFISVSLASGILGGLISICGSNKHYNRVLKMFLQVEEDESNGLMCRIYVQL